MDSEDSSNDYDDYDDEELDHVSSKDKNPSRLSKPLTQASQTISKHNESQTFAKTNNLLMQIVETFSKYDYVNTGHLVLYPPEQVTSSSVQKRDRFNISSQYNKFSGIIEKRHSQIYSCLESELDQESTKKDLLNGLSIHTLLALKQAFEKYPDQRLELDQFVEVMKLLLKNTYFNESKTLVPELIDIFYRVSRTKGGTISFENLTSYLIDQETEVKSEESHVHYFESSIMDTSSHNNYIEKLYYFEQIDKLFLFEQGMKVIKVYNGKTLKKEKRDFSCPACILDMEYIHERYVLGISLSDRTLLFLDIHSPEDNKKNNRRINTPDSQHCLCYVKRKRILFSAGLSGAIYGWSLEKIFSNEYKNLYNRTDSSNYKQFLSTLWFQKCTILHILEIPELNLLATASTDKLIRLWDIRYVEEKEPLDPHKILQGHDKAVRMLAYSSKFKVLVSCGFDFDVLVWNPFSENPIERLKGHEAPLIGVLCPVNTTNIVSSDNKGVIKIWSLRDYTCIQNIYVTNALLITHLVNIPIHRKIIVTSRILHIYQYNKPYAPDLSNDTPITSAIYNPRRFEFIIAGHKSIKVWDAKTGRPVRLFQSIFDSDITAMDLDGDMRNLIVGDSTGRIKLIDSVSGIVFSDLEPHSKEVSFIAYSSMDNTIITTSWDTSITIQRDETKLSKITDRKKLRNIIRTHQDDIACADFSMYMELICTGGRDSKIKIWSYEKAKLEVDLHLNNFEIVFVRFLDPFPLLISSDNGGYLALWDIKSKGKQYRCIAIWQNMFNLTTPHAITAMDYCYKQKDGTLHLFMGDERGHMRVLDISEVITKLGLKPISLEDVMDRQRNPFRILETNAKHEASQSSLIEILKKQALQAQKRKKEKEKQITEETTLTVDSEIQPTEVDLHEAKEKIENLPNYSPVLPETVVKQIRQFDAHSDAIKYIKYIAETDIPLLFTCGFDKMSKLWTLEGTHQGTLRQGTRIQGIEIWSFPLRNFEKNFGMRNNEASIMLEKVKNERLRDFEKKNKEEVSILEFDEFKTPFEDEVTEIVSSEEVFKNLKELEEMLGKSADDEQSRLAIISKTYNSKYLKNKKL